MASYETRIPGITSHRCTVYGQHLIDKVYKLNLGSNGESLAEIAIKLGASKASITRWKKDHPEFKEALDYCMTKSEAHWSKEMRENSSQSNYTGVIPKFFLTHEHKWNDKPERERDEDSTQEEKEAMQRIEEAFQILKKKNEKEV